MEQKKPGLQPGFEFLVCLLNTSYPVMGGLPATAVTATIASMDRVVYFISY